MAAPPIAGIGLHRSFDAPWQVDLQSLVAIRGEKTRRVGHPLTNTKDHGNNWCDFCSAHLNAHPRARCYSWLDSLSNHSP